MSEAEQLTVDTLRDRLDELGVPTERYSLSGAHSYDTYSLRRRGPVWSTFYSDHGNEGSLREFTSEAEACADLLRRLVTEDPC